MVHRDLVKLPFFDTLEMKGQFSMSTQATHSKHRNARIFVGEKGSNRAVRVMHPGKLTSDDMQRIDKVLVNDVIKGLTGCACLSGIIDVIWEREFENVLEVQLGEAFGG
jgi:hypothetical protein